jgi:CRP/FNR family cyclic AMP-dependent transcriptional regulator
MTSSARRVVDVDEDVVAAVGRSHLSGLPVDVLGRLLTGSVRATVARGEVTHREGDPAPHLDLVLSGLLRVCVTAPDGRTMTIRYCRPGALLGAMSLFARPFAMPATAQAVLDTDVLQLEPRVVQGMSHDPRVARTLLTELSERGRAFIREIPGGAFSTVRQRVGRHLLDLASDHDRRRPEATDVGSALVATVTQQELAEAVGTVREVVVRVLRELREEGLVDTSRDGIRLLDPQGLVDEDGGYAWNPGS